MKRHDAHQRDTHPCGTRVQFVEHFVQSFINKKNIEHLSKIAGPQAWAVTTGSEAVTVAVVDSGQVSLGLGLLALFVAFSLGWRWASRIWSLPCPSLTAWRFDNPLLRRMTRATLDRLEIRPGQRILEVGPGPGRLLIPAALSGSALLMASDIVVRLIPSQGEIRVGVVTALIGAPFFIALIMRRRHELSGETP